MAKLNSLVTIRQYRYWVSVLTPTGSQFLPFNVAKRVWIWLPTQACVTSIRCFNAEHLLVEFLLPEEKQNGNTGYLFQNNTYRIYSLIRRTIFYKKICWFDQNLLKTRGASYSQVFSCNKYNFSKRGQQNFPVILGAPYNRVFRWNFDFAYLSQSSSKV